MKKIIGGIITLVIGGTIFAVSETDIVRNFSQNTGMSQEQAQEYIDNISEDDLKTFSELGQQHISDGNALLDGAQSIDCINYVYEWENSLLSCQTGKSQIYKLGKDEISLGTCYVSLDTDLGDSVVPKINECISDIDLFNSDLNYPVVTFFLSQGEITELKNTNLFNKSVLEASLESE